MSITDHPRVQNILAKLRRHSVAGALHVACVRLVNLVVPLRILRALHMERPNLAFIACPPGYRAGFASAAVLARFAHDPANGLSPQFIAQALHAGDECYAIFKDDELAAYGWCSTRPTPVGPSELVLHFMPGHAYRYKGFTLPRYRGQRLHAVGMTRALLHYLSKGYRGIVLHVESTNLDSLKSCRRIGCEVFGSIYLVRIFGRHFSFATPGCRRFDFRVEARKAARRATPYAPARARTRRI